MKRHSSKKIAAFTLFESVLAITIITVLIGLGTLIYSNLMHAEKPLAYYQAKNEIDLKFYELCESQHFLSETFENETYRIEQTVDYYKNNAQVYQVSYVAYSGQKKLLTENHLVINEHNE